MAIDQALPGETRPYQLNTMAPWLAVAAVGIGVAGVVRQMARRRMTTDPFRARLVADDRSVTPPHGDKLLHQGGS